MIEFSVSGIPEVQQRLKNLDRAMRREAEEALLAGVTEIGQAVARNQLSGQMVPVRTGQLRNSGVARLKVLPWGVAASYSFDAKSTSGRKKVAYGFILQWGVDPTKRMTRSAAGNRRRRKNRKRMNFAIAPRPFVDVEMARSGRRIEEKIRTRMLASVEA